MNIPKLDKRTKEDIENRIRQLNGVYTPEWKFSPEHPDIATAMAELYGDMLMEVVEKYNRTPEKNMVEFFSSLGTEPLYAKPAQGHVVFRVSGTEENVKGAEVKKNSVLTAAGENGSVNIYTTADELYVLNSRITDVFSSDTENDEIYRLFQEAQDGIEPDSQDNKNQDIQFNKNVQRHIMAFSGEACDELEEDAQVLLFIQPDSKETGRIDTFLKEVEKSGIYYSSSEGFVKCSNVKITDKVLQLSFQEGLKPEKKELKGIENYWFVIPFQDISAIDNFYIQDIRMGSRVSDLPVKRVCNEMGELFSTHFKPYDRNPIPYTSVYFVQDSVLCHKGADIHLEFRIDYENSPANEEENPEDIEWKNVMKKSRLKKPKEYDISIKQVVWEYFNGSGWVRLFAENQYQDVFNGENEGQLVKIDFTCPDNIEKVFLPTGENYAIRARITTVNNYMKLAASYIVPVVSNPTFSYEYERLPQVETLITENNLEEKIYSLKDCRTSFRPLYKEKKNGHSLYFGFSAPPDMPHINLLFLPDKSEYHENSGYMWEYYGKNGWQGLYCRDETKGLTRTGILSLDAFHEFKKLEKFHRTAYWIRLRYAERKKLPFDNVKQLYLNAVRIQNLEQKDAEFFSVSEEAGYECRLAFGNVYEARVMVNEIENISGVTATEMIQENRAEPVYGDNGELIELWVLWQEASESEQQKNGRTYYLNRDNSTVIFGMKGSMIPPQGENIKITYVTCGGESGNLPAGRSFTMESNGGIFSDITNPVNIYGGSNKEIIGRTLERAAGNLRMNRRICTENDYELAAKYYDRNILKVRCMGNKNAAGEKDYGAVTLIILLANREYFPRISRKLRSYILEINCGNLEPERFQITEPDFVYYRIKLEIKVDSRESYSEKKQHINRKMKQYFDFTSGGEKNTGWEIGRIPEKMAIYNILSGFDDIEEIQYFNVTVFDKNGNELTDGELAEKKELGRMIPMLESTDILVNGN